MSPNNLKTLSLASLIAKAQRELISPEKFYRLCQEIHHETDRKRLYFGEPTPDFFELNSAFSCDELLFFFDALSNYIRLPLSPDTTIFFDWVKDRRKTKILIAKDSVKDSIESKQKKSARLTVRIIGSGAIGRVARLKFPNGKTVAFKAFFDPDFVWQHGPWAEIPVGIRFKYCNVTKNMSEFLFAGEDWAVWEWIEPEDTPQSRLGGLTYEEFAQQEGLTRLNPLNWRNYNPHGIRLDPGGIQKEYWGRRCVDAFKSILFYLRKLHREGWKSLTPYLNLQTVVYALKRLLVSIYPR